MARHPALQAAVDVLADQGRYNHPAIEYASLDQLLACATMDKQAVFGWVLMNHRSMDTDPYARNHSAARMWQARYVELVGHQPADEQAVRAYGMVYYGGFKTAAGCMVRGYREYMQHRPAAWGDRWQHPEPAPSVYLRCPYRRSQHGGASPGGGTFGHIYANAWEMGVWFAVKQLAAAREGV